MKIVVLGGGISSERHVSLVTATSICRGLRERGHKAVFVDMFLGLEDYEKPIECLFDEADGHIPEVSIEKTAPDIAAVISSRKDKSKSHLGKNVIEICALSDFVFLGLHGNDGEDGKIQAALELLGIPYSGSSHLGSAMAMDKSTAKKIMLNAGILTPEYTEIFFNKESIEDIAARLTVPCVIKIVDGGSSIGVSIVDSEEQLIPALNEISGFGNHAIAEKKIVGREMTVPVFDGKCLSAIEIVPPDGTYFDYVSKYQSGNEGAREICPARITEDEYAKMSEAALKLHNSLGLSVYSRVDFILDENSDAWCLEANTLPGMTPNSLIPKAARIAGMSYPELCEKIVELSLKK